MKNILKRCVQGIACGCTICTIISFVAVLLKDPSNIYISQVIASVVVGIGWFAPTVIYANEKLGMGQKILIHFAIGFIVYWPSAFYAGWIPVQYGIWGIVSSVVLMLIFAILIWIGFYMYYKNESKQINNKLKSMGE